jgi:CheY-like chemotaxis protein
MPKRVLSVGQCGFDHGSIAATLAEHFACEVTPVATAAEAERRLAAGPPPDLVLVNRKFDADGDDGLALIRALKQAPATAAVPVMLVSNYAEYQAQAAAAGAAAGFGKAELARPQTLEKLRPFLG